MDLISFLTPIRMSSGDTVDNASVKANHGAAGLDSMLDVLFSTSAYMEALDDRYKFSVILKIDECDQEAIDWLSTPNYEKYSSYVKYVISPREHIDAGGEVHNAPRMHYTHIHHWLHECYQIAPKSKYYMLWNHFGHMLTQGWDKILHDYSGPVDKVISPHHPSRPGGALAPIVHHSLVQANIDKGIKTPIAGGSPFDTWWEKAAGWVRFNEISIGVTEGCELGK